MTDPDTVATYQSVAEELRKLADDAGFDVESVSDGEWIQLLARA